MNEQPLQRVWFTRCNIKPELMMETTKEIPQWAIADAVKDCRDVYEFAYKYYKPERFTGWGDEYVAAVMKSRLQDIVNHGYTCISRHDNITGRFITFIPEQDINKIGKIK